MVPQGMHTAPRVHTECGALVVIELGRWGATHALQLLLAEGRNACEGKVGELGKLEYGVKDARDSQAVAVGQMNSFQRRVSLN